MTAAPPPLRIYFLGSGAIGAPALAALRQDARVQILGVGTQPDRPAGRKMQLQPSPLAQAALSAGLEVERVPDVNATDFIQRLQALRPDLILVIAFGQLLKMPILELPPLGCINVHASLLPAYRGASPIFQSILNGDEESGVTIMRMTRGLDTGPVHMLHRLRLHPQETTGSLEVRLGILAADHIVADLLDIAAGNTPALHQDDTQASVCKKISKSLGDMDFSIHSTILERRVRACQPWPGARCCFPTQRGPRPAIITSAALASTETQLPPGQPLVQDGRLIVACGDGSGLEILSLRPLGGRDMTAREFLLGSPLEPCAALQPVCPA